MLQVNRKTLPVGGKICRAPSFPQELYVEAYATVFSASSGGGGGGGGRRRGVLPEGVHTFAFRFVLPENLPSSFEGKFGRVKQVK